MLVKRPRSRLAMITTIVESRSSVRVGQLAFWSSPIISPTKMRVLWNGFFMDCCVDFLKWQGRRESNPQPTVLEPHPLPMDLPRERSWNFLEDGAEAPWRTLGEPVLSGSERNDYS